MEQAESFIFLEYFILAEGKLWNKMFGILKERAAHGVEVKILFDDFGIGNVIESKNVIAIILAAEKHLAFICRQQSFIQTLLKLKGFICPLQFREHFLPGRTAKEVIVQQAYLFP